MSSNLKNRFEAELKNKLSQKSYGNTKEETVLIKAFRYFDLDNSGACTKDEFIKTVYKIGLVGFSQEELSSVFSMYDKNHSNELDYKEFTAFLYDNKSIVSKRKKDGLQGNDYPEQANENLQPITSQENLPNQQYTQSKENIQDNIQASLEKLRSNLSRRGVSTICSMAKHFRIIDTNNSQTISFDEFVNMSQLFHFNLKPEELQLIFDAFDKNRNGEIDYDEFLRSLRGDMNERRKAIVRQAFDILDVNKNGQISFDEIKMKYNAKSHPEVLAGKKTEEEILKQFMDTFQDTYNYLCGTESDNIITIEEFNEYYENVSMSIDNDEYFELLLNNAWRMNNANTVANEKKGWSNQQAQNYPEEKNVKKINDIQNEGDLQREYNKKYGDNRPAAFNEEEFKESQDTSFKKLKRDVISRGAVGIFNLARQFKIYDDNSNKLIDIDNFNKVMKEFRTTLSNSEILDLFNNYRTKDTLNYDLLLNKLKGSLSTRRKAVVLQAFDKLDIDKSGIVELNDIKSLYNCKNHRDVKLGKRTEEEVYSEFLETFQMHHNVYAGLRSKRVTKDEFLDYYTCISLVILDDEYYVKMIQSAWKLNPSYTNDFSPKKNDKDYNNEINDVPEPQSRHTETGSRAAPFGTDDNQDDEPKYRRAYKGGNNNNYINNYNSKGTTSQSVTPLEKFKNVLSRRGTRGIMGMRRAFMIADDDGSKNLSLEEFIKFLHDYRINLSEDEAVQLFNLGDIDNSGKIDYEEFVRLVVGPMNERRKNIVIKAFNKLDRTGNGVVDLDDIRDVYDPSKHPDVINGKKTQDEILAEFLDTFEYHFSLLNENASKDRKISLEEFIEYYNNISFSIDNDDLFEEIIISAYNLDNRRSNNKKGWKGEY